MKKRIIIFIVVLIVFSLGYLFKDYINNAYRDDNDSLKDFVKILDM